VEVRTRTRTLPCPPRSLFSNTRATLHHNSTYRVPMPSGMQLVIFVPDIKSETAVTRKLIKDTIPRKDAIFNMSRTALMVRAFCTGDLDDLRLATQVCDERRRSPWQPTGLVQRALRHALDAKASTKNLVGIFEHPEQICMTGTLHQLSRNTNLNLIWFKGYCVFLRG
jgi:hypothetical protein